jgi:predicted ribosomally synthesized peptide with SipW-like signal peptide
MKRFAVLSFLFLFTIVVMALGISGSGAWFTDQVRLDNNSITTGKLELVISDVAQSNPTLEPGGDYQEILRFCVKNGGSYNMKWRGILTSIEAPAGLENQVLLRAISNPEPEFSGNYGAAKAIWFKNQPATALMVANPYLLVDVSTNSEPFKPNDRICYSFQAKLAESAGSEFEKKSFAATLQLDATQWISTEDWSK